MDGETALEGSMTPPPPANDGLDLPTLVVEGELDLAVAPWLRDQLDALYVGGADSVVVDLSAATFLDSTALGVLVSALNRSRERGGIVHLVVQEPQILRVLTITGLQEEFALHKDRAELLRRKGEL